MTNSDPPICDYENSDYTASFWDQGGREYEDRAEQIALKQLLPGGGEKMLELGAGAGRNSSRYPGFDQIVLVDYSLSQLQQAGQKLGSSEKYVYVAADIYRLPFVDGLFDAATMIRTLHHMADPELALQQVRKALQNQAVFILEYANKHNLKAILRYLFRQQSWSPFSQDSIEFEKLNFDFHPVSVERWLQRTGFSLQVKLAVSYFRLGVIKRTIPVDLLARLEAWVQPSGRWCLLSPSVFTRNQAVGDTPKAQPGTFFKCPVCQSAAFERQERRLICQGCLREWPVVDGIFDFRVKRGS